MSLSYNFTATNAQHSAERLSYSQVNETRNSVNTGEDVIGECVEVLENILLVKNLCINISLHPGQTHSPNVSADPFG